MTFVELTRIMAKRYDLVPIPLVNFVLCRPTHLQKIFPRVLNLLSDLGNDLLCFGCKTSVN